MSLQCTILTGSEVIKSFGLRDDVDERLVALSEGTHTFRDAAERKTHSGKDATGPPVAKIWIARSGLELL